MKNKPLITEGQLSIFDIQITEKSISSTKTEKMNIENKVLVTEKPVLDTKIINMDIKEEIEKTENPLKPTEKQQQFLNKNKFKENGNLSRIIIHSKGSITVEIKESDTFISHYINTEGKEEFNYSKKSLVLPWDKIIYYTSELKDISLTKIQVDKLQKMLCKQRESIQRVIHRKGDENILIEFTDRIISITPIGWELPFESLDHIDCEEDEVYMMLEKVTEKAEPEDPEEIQKKVKAGDYVQALHNKEIIEGRITREYGLGNEILNIIFANGTRHTAIGRKAVKKILKSA